MTHVQGKMHKTLMYSLTKNYKGSIPITQVEKQNRQHPERLPDTLCPSKPQCALSLP